MLLHQSSGGALVRPDHFVSMHDDMLLIQAQTADVLDRGRQTLERGGLLRPARRPTPPYTAWCRANAPSNVAHTTNARPVGLLQRNMVEPRPSD
jgi:hypothetical protein